MDQETINLIRSEVGDGAAGLAMKRWDRIEQWKAMAGNYQNSLRYYPKDVYIDGNLLVVR